MSERGLTILLCMATALIAGFVIGAEREQGQRATFGGVRTFPLFALAGALGALINVWLLVAMGLSLGALLTVSYVRETHDADEGDLGLSTEIAALVTFGLGALSCAEDIGLPMVDRLLVVGGGATAVLALLALKRKLHDFVARVSKEDVYATAKLLLLAVVILPLLPNRDLGPWGALNPRNIGLLVVLISGIGFAGYVAVRAFGARKGLGLTGLLGGLASSTAVTLTFSGRAKENRELVPACAVAIVLASSTMFPRVIIELAAVSPQLAGATTWPLIVATVVGLAAGGISYARLSMERRRAAQPEQPLALKNPLTLSSAFKFALLFTAVLLLTKAAMTYVPQGGVLLSALVTGLADVDAIALTIAGLHDRGALELGPALISVGAAVASNTVSKVGIAAVLGGRALAARVAVPMAAALAAGAITAWLVHGFG